MHLPVFLGRRPDEQPDRRAPRVLRRLLARAARPRLPRGEWQLGERSRLGRQRHAGRTWSPGAGAATRPRKLVVVNLGDAPAAGHVSLPWDDLRGPGVAARRRRERRGLRAQRRRPPRRAVRRARPVVLAPLRRDPTGRRRTDDADRPATAEHARLAEATGRAEDDLFSANPWYEWGPYLSERAWGTVREDYSEGGDAWDSFPHDHARSRAYRWNEDGMAGISDIRHELCLALALWNGKDPILKERMFGLTGPQGNHGEDVKEYWWYLEGLPSHALLQLALPLPAGRLPVRRARPPRPRPPRSRARAARHRRVRRRPLLVGRRHLREGLADRGPRCGSSVENHGPEEATLDVLPTLWFRNTWSWDERGDAAADRARRLGARRRRPRARRLPARGGARPRRRAPEALFCENETNAPRVFGSDATTPYPKDGINDHVVSGAATVNPDGFGTKAALRYRVTVPAGGKAELRLRLHGPGDEAPTADWAGAAFDETCRRARGGRGRVLRRARAGRHRRRADADPAPVVRRARLEQADVPLQRAPLAGRRPRRAAAAGGPPARPQQRLAPPRRLRRARDAGPVGVPVVRGVGSRLPHHPLGAPRSRVREVPAHRAAARVVPAPERRAARVRVELRRRQPAGARDGRDPRLPSSTAAATASSSSGSSRSCSSTSRGG